MVWKITCVHSHVHLRERREDQKWSEPPFSDNKEGSEQVKGANGNKQLKVLNELVRVGDKTDCQSNYGLNASLHLSCLN